jgi:hypothetical protein
MFKISGRKVAFPQNTALHRSASGTELQSRRDNNQVQQQQQ